MDEQGTHCKGQPGSACHILQTGAETGAGCAVA